VLAVHKAIISQCDTVDKRAILTTTNSAVDMRADGGRVMRFWGGGGVEEGGRGLDPDEHANANGCASEWKIIENSPAICGAVDNL
jgi:hypothetical protein